MKYILMMSNTKCGTNGIMTWPMEDIQRHIGFMMSFSKSLGESGELVSAEGLAFPEEAKLVRAAADGTPVTDGVFPETKEFLAGYWIVDVEIAERAYQIAAQASAAPGKGGVPMNMAIEVRQVMSGPASRIRVIGRLDAAGEHLLRGLAPQVLGSVVRRFRDFAAAEDSVQEAMVAASVQWPRDGVPENPRAWLIQVASRRMTDHVRSEIARRRRESVVAAPPDSAAAPVAEDGDDTLILLLMCCHPALSASSAIALTLRAVGGLTTAEIAHAFMVPEATMAQRISRAKQGIKASGMPFGMPEGDDRAQRLRVVLHVLYLIFNEGYSSSGGAHLQRGELAVEAVRLTRCVRALLPDDCEVAGLLALMLLTDARRAARTGSRGELIPLTRQDRSLWDAAQITEGVALLTETLPKGRVGGYQLQAAIAAVHDEAASADATDWPQILMLYDMLLRLSDNPMVRLNRAVAVAMVRGPRAGLELLHGLEGALSSHHRLSAVRAHLLELAGEREAAIAEYGVAAGRTGSLPERNYLMTQAARLRDG